MTSPQALKRVIQAFDEVGRGFGDAGSDLSPDVVLDALSQAGLKAVPTADWGSVTVSRGVPQGRRAFETVAATHDEARAADGIQYEVGSGPCLDAIVDEATYRPVDIARDGRWPVFGQRVASELGVHSMLSIRVQNYTDRLIAGLNLYSTERGAFDQADEDVAALLATHAGLAVTAAEDRATTADLRRALQSNRDIGVAIGILMSQLKIPRDQAFDLLRIASQSQHRKLRSIALEVAETGELFLPPADGGRDGRGPRTRYRGRRKSERVREGTTMELANQWAQVVAASTAPGSDEQRQQALAQALGMGMSVTADSVGCSVTELTPDGFRTPAASTDIAMALDLAQYDADAGPCVAACRDGRPHRIVAMATEAGWAGFTATAAAHDVRSSLSLPLAGTGRPSALNLYASSASAFETDRARTVASLLARCVAALLPAPDAAADRSPELASAQAAHGTVVEARLLLESRHALSPGAAFHRLTELSRTEQRGVLAIARDLLDRPEPAGA